MSFSNPFSNLVWGNLFATLLPDFILAFAFFASLAYVVFGKRFGTQRPAVAMSGAVGLALAIGLVWWEQANGLSIRNLGPIAVGFAIIILGGVIYQSIRGNGGSWAGAGIALGACLMIGWLLGLDWRLDPRIVQTITTVALTVGVLAFLLHRRGLQGQGFSALGRAATAEFDEARHDASDLYQDERLSRRLGKGFRELKKKAGGLFEHPEGADNVALQLRRMLPAEGWLTEHLARLREKAHHMRVGHITQVEEIGKHLGELPVPARRKAASELAAIYKELRFDERLERLDRAVAANEQRIKQLTAAAQQALTQHDHRRLVDLLDQAGKLQKHNSTLLKAIRRTEAHLESAAKQVAKKAATVKTS
jgi:uncharacterized coiled-coil protein SlyX